MRYKTFQATGVAPDGRLYAGDLNWMQDLKVDLSNFAQTVELAGLRLGETGLQLVRYGTLEARLTGALRVDGILRGLGGIIPGTFTNAQRDAIPLGFAPYGMAILNAESNKWEWNRGTDGSRDWITMGSQKTVQDIGDGAAKSFRITHNYQTKDVVVFVRETASPFRQVFPEIQIEDVNYVDIVFDIIPANNAYRALVMA